APGAGAGAEAQHGCRFGCGGNRGEVGDAADVLHDASPAAVAKQRVVKERDERRAPAARSHVCRTKVGNHWGTETRGHHCSLARLPGTGDLPSSVVRGFALVVDGLAVAADAIQPGAAHASPRRTASLCTKPPEPE